MNPVLILTHNCLELTKRCVESIRAQVLPTTILAFDNASNDGTQTWLAQEGIHALLSMDNKGVSFGWNKALTYIFEAYRYEHVLVVNNDTVLPPWFYSRLLSYDLPFVTGMSVDSMDAISYPTAWESPAECPDFSLFLIRRSAWETIGTFDEGMKHYASDIDYHIRARRSGVTLWNSGVPFYHERSSTLKLATPEERRFIEIQADADRDYFKAKWGYPVEEAGKIA